MLARIRTMDIVNPNGNAFHLSATIEEESRGEGEDKNDAVDFYFPRGIRCYRRSKTIRNGPKPSESNKPNNEMNKYRERERERSPSRRRGNIRPGKSL